MLAPGGRTVSKTRCPERGPGGRPLEAGREAAQCAVGIRSEPHGEQAVHKECAPNPRASLVFPTLQAVQGPERFASRSGVTVCAGDVAQLGEHLLCKQGVSGSSPLISTMAP